MDSYVASAGKFYEKPPYFVAPGIYQLTGISHVGKISSPSRIIHIVEEVPQCTIQVRDSATQDPIHSCQLIVNDLDTIAGSNGEFDLTGFVYESCTIGITHGDYFDCDTTLVVRSDTTLVVVLVKISTGVARAFVDREVRIFPNPTKDLITVQTSKTGTFSYRITSMNGQVVQSGYFVGSSHMIDFSSYPTGVIFLTIKLKDSKTTIRIFKL